MTKSEIIKAAEELANALCYVSPICNGLHDPVKRQEWNGVIHALIALAPGEDEKRIDWMESKANEGRFEIARSLFMKGYEFGYWPKSGPVAEVHAGTLREAIDKAMLKAAKDKK